MKILSTIILLATFGLGSTLGNQAQAKEKWICTKDGATLKVKGHSSKDQQKHCEEQAGIWEKNSHKEGKQSSGSGGSW